MGYGQALEEAWSSIKGFKGEGRFKVTLLSQTYIIDTGTKSVFLESTNAPAKEYTSIIILHYLARSLSPEKLPAPSGEWIDFNQLRGAESYYPTYRKRTIERLINKYGSGKGDIKRIIKVLDGVDIMIKISRADEEFSADAAILYDRSVERIFCVEDIVVLTEIVVHTL
ncbi:MAG: DUF3786 domain-containing protein [Candidatus Omnitrophica bacterium]|nr:DUF3786 domain-containing protein [Candidatus Omnitrophota bacterium]